MRNRARAEPCHGYPALPRGRGDVVDGFVTESTGERREEAGSGEKWGGRIWGTDGTFTNFHRRTMVNVPSASSFPTIPMPRKPAFSSHRVPVEEGLEALDQKTGSGLRSARDLV